jgi:hypothetical protein
MRVEIRYNIFPKEWGHHIICQKSYKEPTKEDLETLEDLRVHFDSRRGDILSYKWDIGPYMRKKYGRIKRATLGNLWRAGLITKFATTFHTQSGFPNYTSWYIWGDYGQGYYSTGLSTRTIFNYS